MATAPRPIDIGPMLPAIYAKWPELAELLKKLNDMLQRQRQAFAATTAVTGTTGTAATGSITFSTDGTITSTVSVDASGNATVDLDVAPEAITASELGPAAVTTVKVADENITYPKMQNVSAASRLLGRGSAAGAGNVEELTLGTGMSMSGTTLNGPTVPTPPVASDFILSGAIGSLPAASTAGLLYLPTDAPFSHLRDNGSTWDYFRHGILCTKTVAADWTWVNQGTFTATDSKGCLRIAGTDTSANHRLLKRSVGATPWAKKFGVIFTTQSSPTQLIEFGFRESSSSKLIMYIHAGRDSNVQKFNSESSFNSNYFTRGSMFTTAPELWVELSDTGTTRYIKLSHDGIHFAEVHQSPRTEFLTADEVFIGVYNDGGSPEWGATLFSYS